MTMAEYFRDDEHRDVLLLIDNIFRFIQAGMEVSGLMGQIPSRLGYQPTMGTELSGLEERIANTRHGLDHIDSGSVRAGRRHDRPGGGAHVFAPLRVDRSLTQAGQRGTISGHRSAAIQLQDGDAERSSVSGITAWRSRSARRWRTTSN